MRNLPAHWLVRSRLLTFLAGIVLGGGLWLLNRLVRVLLFYGEDAPDPLLGQGGEGVFELAGLIALGVYLLSMWRTRREMAESLRKVSWAVEQSPSSVVITNLKGNIEYVNPKFTNLTGYSLDEVRGKNPRILKSGETPRDTYARMWQTITAGGEWRGEFHNVKKNGEMYWEMASISAIKDHQGRVTHFLAVKEDITARKAAEMAEREQRRLAEALADMAAVLNSTLDLDQVLDHLLETLGQVVPHDAANVMFVEGDFVRVVRASYRQGDGRQPAISINFPMHDQARLRLMLDSGEPVVVADAQQSGQSWPEIPDSASIGSYVGAPIRREGRVIGFLNLYGAALHFYDQRHAERLQAFADQAAIAIRNAQLYFEARSQAAEMERRVIQRTAELDHERAQLRAILESMGEGVFYVEQGGVRYSNRALAQMIGYSPEDLRRAPEVLHQMLVFGSESYSDLRREVDASFGVGQVWRGQVRVRHRSGADLDLALTITPVFGSDDWLVGSVTVVRDISREKELEQRKERFLTNAAHELRTPVSNIKTRLYLVRNQPHRIEQHLAVMEQVTENMRQLIDDLLDAVRLDRRGIRAQRECLDLCTVVQDVCRMQQGQAERRGVQLITALPDRPLLACAQRKRLSQAVSNLILNSVYHTPPGGEVQIMGESTPDQQAVLRIYHQGPDLEPGQLAQVFEPFFRPSEASESLGLGLAIAREIIKLHDGEVTFESEPGQPASYTIRLDLYDDCQECQADDGGGLSVPHIAGVSL